MSPRWWAAGFAFAGVAAAVTAASATVPASTPVLALIGFVSSHVDRPDPSCAPPAGRRIAGAGGIPAPPYGESAAFRHDQAGLGRADHRVYPVPQAEPGQH